MQTIYFMRHCKTELNIQGRISGIQESDLIKGAEINKWEELQHNRLVILSSDLPRCRKTVELLVDKLEYVPEIHYCDLLRERNMGVFEGKRRSDMIEQYPEYFADQRFCYRLTPPEGESFEKFAQRADRVIKEELEQFHDCEVLVCAHNQILKLLWCILLNRSVETEWRKIDFIGGTVTRVE